MKQERIKKRLLSFSLLLLLGMALISCQSSHTKKEIVGKWAYSGGGPLTVLWFEKNDNFTMKQLSGFRVLEGYGTYKVDGRNIHISWKDNDGDARTGSLRLSENNRLFALDGTEYVKVEDF